MNITKAVFAVGLLLASSQVFSMRVVRCPTVYALQAADARVQAQPKRHFASNSLPEGAYAQCVERIQKKTYATGRSFPVDWRKYCNVRVQNWDKLRQRKIALAAALVGLDSRDPEIFNVNLLEVDNAVAFAHSFAQASQQLLQWRVRLLVGAHIDELEEFEKNYNPPLKQITAKEYKEKLSQKNITEELLGLLQVEEAAYLAKHALEKSVEAKL